MPAQNRRQWNPWHYLPYVSPPEPSDGAPSGIGKIRGVELREVWRHEAYDFTTWLEHNPDVLSEALGIVIDNVERERSVGNFRVDLRGEDASGNAVVIENQLERSDHDHLGKLITYVAASQAHTAIWIVSDPRPEHVGAITWLNESATADFFLVKVEAIRIGDSPAAPLLTLITGPSAETRQAGAQNRRRPSATAFARRSGRPCSNRPAASTIPTRASHPAPTRG